MTTLHLFGSNSCSPTGRWCIPRCPYARDSPSPYRLWWNLRSIVRTRRLIDSGCLIVLPKTFDEYELESAPSPFGLAAAYRAAGAPESLPPQQRQLQRERLERLREADRKGQLALEERGLLEQHEELNRLLDENAELDASLVAVLDELDELSRPYLAAYLAADGNCQSQMVAARLADLTKFGQPRQQGAAQSDSTAAASQHRRGRDDSQLRPLQRLFLPTLEKLSDSTLLALRNEPGAFAEWRSSLRRALQEIQELPEDESDWPAQAIAILGDSILPRKLDLELALGLARRLLGFIRDMSVALWYVDHGGGAGPDGGPARGDQAVSG